MSKIKIRKILSRGAYSGSVCQQSFGESLENHGFLIWDIQDKTYEEVNIINKHGYVIVTLNTGFNYDDLKNSKELDLFSVNNNKNLRKIRLRIDWKDISANINLENERKIRKFLKEKYSDFLVDLKFKKTIIGDKIIDDKIEIPEKIDLLNAESLREIFNRFLIANGHTSETIADILELDKIISNRFIYEEKMVNWKLLSLTLDNYRSHGDEFELPLEDVKGLIQIRGKNEQGKTNLLSSICYLLYGKTLETLKKEKNGDNRFINNKRNLDYCQVGGILEINSEKYELIRRSERKWNKQKEIGGVSTSLNFKRLDPLTGTYVEDLNEEQRRSTEKLITESLGNFDDFLRSSFITADSLNGLLSTDEAVFIDSILRDSGLDLFEKKLSAFKEYKKENPIVKPRIDVVQEEIMIDQNAMEIDSKNNECHKLNHDIGNQEQHIVNDEMHLKLGESKIIKVEGLLTYSEIQGIQLEVSNLNSQKNQLIAKNNANREEIKKYPTEFSEEDNEQLVDAEMKSVTHYTWVEVIKPELIALQQSKSKCENNKILLSSGIKVYQNANASIDREIASLKSASLSKIESLQKQIKQINESTVCYACGRLKEDDAESIAHTQKLIEGLEKEISDIENSKEDKKKIKGLLKDQESNLAEITKSNNSILNEDDNIVKINETIKEKESLFLERHTEHNKILTTIQNLQKKRELVIRRINISSEIDHLELQVNVLEDKVVDLNKKISDNEENSRQLLQNEEIEKQNASYRRSIENSKIEVDRLKETRSRITHGDIPILQERIRVSKDNVHLFKIEEKKEIIQQVYLNCIHRDGIPKMLLSEMRNTINVEISNLLAPLSFGVLFDENMTPKMFDHIKPEAMINVIGGSGKQRTFISLALRLALREINNRCVNNLLFMDELMGKLVENSVTEFIELLDEAKLKIEKIFIVEHAYSDLLNPDYIIDIEKNEKGISEIKLTGI